MLFKLGHNQLECYKKMTHDKNENVSSLAQALDIVYNRHNFAL